MNLLQQIFATLQYGAENVCDPSPLVKALDIDTGIQQDAQE